MFIYLFNFKSLWWWFIFMVCDLEVSSWISCQSFTILAMEKPLPVLSWASAHRGPSFITGMETCIHKWSDAMFSLKGLPTVWGQAWLHLPSRAHRRLWVLGFVSSLSRSWTYSPTLLNLSFFNTNDQTDINWAYNNLY